MQYAVKNILQPPKLSDMQLQGSIGQQMDRFFEERVLSFFAREVIYAETEEKFRLREDDLDAVGMFSGEFWGKWVISACRVCRYKQGEGLRQFVRQAALNLLATADENGYIGTYKNPLNCFAPDPPIPGRPKWNWNIWCRKYTLWALLEVYELTGEKDVLQGAVRFADQLIDMLKDHGIRLGSTGTFNGLPSGSIMKPMLILYRLTSQPKYLNFCLEIAADWEREDGRIPNLIANALSEKPVHTWYPDSHLWAKAYEMMSCLDGLLELYRLTGTEKYLRSVQAMYRLLKEHEGNALFSVGFNDIFAHAAVWDNACTEPCDVIHWMRLCSELYKLTGEAEYMEALELAFLNPFLAASFEDGKWGARAVRTCGRHQVATGQSGMQHSHCCVNNMPRGYLNACESFVMQGAEGLYINLYTSFECSFPGIRVQIGGSYLRDGRVSLSISSDQAIDLHLRIPSWSRETRIGEQVVKAAGGYHALTLAAGENRLEIDFDMNPRLREMSAAPERFESVDFRVRRFVTGNDISEDIMTWDRRGSVMYGPLLLARSKRIGSTEEEMFHSPTVCGRGFSCRVEPIEGENVRNAFCVTFQKGEERVKIRMCDYATGSNLWSQDDPMLFNIYV